jgi:pyruvate,water dikinase
MRTHYILNLKEGKSAQNIGNKAQSLRYLLKHGYRVPEAQVCIWDAFVQFRKSDTKIVRQVQHEVSAKLDGTRRYAIRSSANIEDSRSYSFAGQFKSVLNAHGVDAVMQAIVAIWESATAGAVQSYMKKIGIDPDSVRMAVIIQEMVSPVFSGVAFSRNPITGMDEIVVEAVRGTSEALLQEGITPNRWIYKWGEWIALPEHEDIPREIIDEVVTHAKGIAKSFGKPVDLEWAYDGSHISWVQLREITTLKNLNVYSNYIAREVMPGIIKPLVWSINVPMVNTAWKEFLSELIGAIEIDAHALAKSFYYRTYFNMGVIGNIFSALGLPPETIELLMGIYREGSHKPRFRLTPKILVRLPRILRVVVGKLRFARSFKVLFPAIQETYNTFMRADLHTLSETALIDEIDKLCALCRQTAYYNIIVQLMMGLYNMLLKWQLKKMGIDFASFDLTGGMDELKEFDPTIHILVMQQQFRQLPNKIKEQFLTCSCEEFSRIPDISHMQKEFTSFIQRFGHLSDSGNDFSAVPWRENPDVILKMIISSQQSENQSVRNCCFEDVRTSAVRRLFFGPIVRNARTFRVYREQVSFLYTFGYGLLRSYFLTIADIFVTRGFLADRSDIFYLTFDEIKDIAKKGCGDRAAVDAIALRKKEIVDYQDMILPNVIYGDHAPPVMHHTGNTLKGTPTSRGYHRGAVKVVKGIKDFSKVDPGNVLVIPYSDVGWTPLFTKAGAIIAESGGILSHSSIIAREYNIPAVVSVSGACQLKDNTLVSVDGYLGEILVHEG